MKKDDKESSSSKKEASKINPKLLLEHQINEKIIEYLELQTPQALKSIHGLTGKGIQENLSKYASEQRIKECLENLTNSDSNEIVNEMNIGQKVYVPKNYSIPKHYKNFIYSLEPLTRALYGSLILTGLLIVTYNYWAQLLVNANVFGGLVLGTLLSPITILIGDYVIKGYNWVLDNIQSIRREDRSRLAAAAMIIAAALLIYLYATIVVLNQPVLSSTLISVIVTLFIFSMGYKKAQS